MLWNDSSWLDPIYCSDWLSETVVRRDNTFENNLWCLEQEKEIMNGSEE